MVDIKLARIEVRKRSQMEVRERKMAEEKKWPERWPEKATMLV